MPPHRWLGPHLFGLPHWGAIEWLTFVIGLGTLASAALIGLTAFLARGALRDAERTRHAQLVISLNEQWVTQAVKDSMAQYASFTEASLEALIGRLFDPKEPPGNIGDYEAYKILTVVAELIETIGVLCCSEEAITAELVYNAWGGTIMYVWETWRLAAIRYRKLEDQPELFRYFEALAMEMKRIDAERRPAPAIS